MATWYIIDGDLPFLEEFPPMPSIDDAPNSLWKIIDGNLPFKSAFPQMPSIDDAPNSLWLIHNGDLPYKALFPEMHEYEPFTGVQDMYKGELKVKNVFLTNSEVNMVCLGDWAVFKKPVDG